MIRDVQKPDASLKKPETKCWALLPKSVTLLAAKENEKKPERNAIETAPKDVPSDANRGKTPVSAQSDHLALPEEAMRQATGPRQTRHRPRNRVHATGLRWAFLVASRTHRISRRPHRLRYLKFRQLENRLRKPLESPPSP